MASNNLYIKILLLLLVVFATYTKFSSATPRILALVKQNPLVLKYHKGILLKGNVNVNIIWYGKFTSTQRSIIVHFFQSLSPKNRHASPPLSVSSWWRTTANYKGVEDFCMSRCGTHRYIRGKNGKKYAYAWVGNSGSQCPGQCAWPFQKPIVGPQTPPLLAPNGDVGVDGMVINLATVLAGAVTNPFDGGYFQGPPSAPLEAVTA
ncbi:Protein EXORDIUM-like 2 [Forsythia ovata]|uniref:Protein EXORDIUM-like 2 n=1 Tax=Forsythia ovata TaxID=205694 RepID=A0ABD1PW07_9LAMI